MLKCKKCGFPKPLSEFPEYTTAQGKRSCRHMCLECKRKYHQGWWDKNKEERAPKNRQWALDHPVRFRSLRSKWMKKKFQDPIFRLEHNLRSRVRQALKGELSSKIAISLLGCSLEDCRKHLEQQFRDGMTWDNHGKVWHIDHIIPCRAFNLKDENERRECFHFSNLQPLLVSENLKKADKLPSGVKIRRLC